jgi:hypothetical protein
MIKNQRTHQKLAGAVFIILTSINLACSDNTSRGELTTPDLQAIVEGRLTEMGIEFEEVAVDEGSWQATIDRDIIVDLKTLLGDSAEGFATTLRTQGYYHMKQVVGGQTTYPQPKGTAKLVFAANVSAAWRTAFSEAAAQWNPNVCININTTTGSTLNVEASAFGPSDTYADAQWPTVGQGGILYIGPRIRLNTNFQGGIENLSAQLKRHVAMHELGHALGFAHRGDLNHINGTASGAYSTVMNARFGAADSLPSLSADDITSRDTVFKKVPVPRQLPRCP